MDVIELNVELLSQLTIDGLDNLTNSIERAANSLSGLVGLITTGQGPEFEAIIAQQLASQFGADVAFITEDCQIGVLCQQLSTDRQVSRTGRSQLKIQDQPAQADQQMQFEAKDGDCL